MPCIANEIASIVEKAYNTKSPLNIIGAGTKSFLGEQVQNCNPLNVTGHSGIIEYDPAELVLVARAGTSLQDIETVLGEHRQMLGFEPPFVDAGATLGGPWLQVLPDREGPMPVVFVISSWAPLLLMAKGKS